MLKSFTLFDKNRKTLSKLTAENDVDARRPAPLFRHESISSESSYSSKDNSNLEGLIILCRDEKPSTRLKGFKRLYHMVHSNRNEDVSLAIINDHRISLMELFFQNITNNETCVQICLFYLLEELSQGRIEDFNISDVIKVINTVGFQSKVIGVRINALTSLFHIYNQDKNHTDLLTEEIIYGLLSLCKDHGMECEGY